MTTATRTNEARSYALTIASELLAVEALHDFIQEGSITFSDEEAFNELLAEEPVKTRKEILDALDTIGGFDNLDEYNSVSMAYLESVALEISYTIKGTIGSHEKPDLHSVSILRTFGGPNCWLETFDGETFEVRTYWGGDTYNINRVKAPTLAAALWEICEEVTR